MVPLPPREPMFAVSVCPTWAVPLMVTVPVSWVICFVALKVPINGEGLINCIDAVVLLISVAVPMVTLLKPGADVLKVKTFPFLVNVP
jgi:hypothetical protein